jgi:hypothetical protein
LIFFRFAWESILPDDFIISIIDEENNSLLHYLVVWGYSAGIQLLEIESTWKTTLTNKRNYTPVHFAAYWGILFENNSITRLHIETLFHMLMMKLDAH